MLRTQEIKKNCITHTHVYTHITHHGKKGLSGKHTRCNWVLGQSNHFLSTLCQYFQTVWRFHSNELVVSLPRLLGDSRMMQLNSRIGAYFRNSHFQQLNSWMEQICYLAWNMHTTRTTVYRMLNPTRTTNEAAVSTQTVDNFKRHKYCCR